MSKIAVPKLNRRQFFAATPTLGGVFMALVDAQKRTAQNQQLMALSSLPVPKFSIGQRVIEHCTVDDSRDSNDGLTYQNKGVVIGFWWNDEELEKPNTSFHVDFFYDWTGWVYVVKFFDLPLDPHIKQEVSTVPEDELHLEGQYHD